MQVKYKLLNLGIEMKYEKNKRINPVLLIA
jgi:hypothetical protein